MSQRLPLAPLFAALCAGLASSQERDPSLPQGPAWLESEEGAAITAEQIETKLRYLASDALEGRDTGSRGSMAAAWWMADGLRALGFEGGGDPLEGRDARSFLQDIQRPKISLLEPPAIAAYRDGELLELAQGRDYDMIDARASEATLRLHVVSQDADLPEAVDPEVALVLDGRSSQRRAWLEELGTPDGRGWGAVVRRGRRSDGEAQPSTRLMSTATGDRIDMRLHGETWERVLAGEIQELAFAIGAVESSRAYNVIGYLPGVGTPENPDLAEEVVVLTAHYDHLGQRALRPGEDPETDTIYNGADDDGTGVVTVLELAEALAHGARPARTVVVMLVTGEEKGLLGTYHYLEAPLFSLENTVCNLNFEMLGRPDDLAGGPGKLWLSGYERSNLGDALAARKVPVVADPRPEQNFFQRSDNYAFARLGIVAQTLSSYNMHEEYHTVDDDADAVDYAHMQEAVRSCLVATLLMTSGELAPSWLPGGDPSQR